MNIIEILGSTFCLYIFLLLAVRFMGLRSFSKLSSFDFALTISVGSIIGGSLLVDSTVMATQGVIALLSIFAFKFILSWLRKHFDPIDRLVNNEPLMVMEGTEILHKNLTKAMMTEGDLYSKLREANVLKLSQIKYVVVESTGDVSVLHSADEELQVDNALLEGIRK